VLEFNCLICNKKVTVANNRKNAKYCSQECYWKSMKNVYHGHGFKKGHKHSKETCSKISHAHQGIQKPWLRKEPLIRICKYCERKFKTKIKKKIFCNRSCAQRWNMSQESYKKKVFTNSRNQKISNTMKGRIPKNLKDLIINCSMQYSPKQQELFSLVKKYFPNAKYNYYIKTNVSFRFLDIAIIELKLDIEYNGKCHLLKSVIKNDRNRVKDLNEIGWKILVFDRNNIHTANKTLKGVYDTVDNH